MLARVDGDPRDLRLPLPDGAALQILTTEHWSLLTARSLVYNETFARGGMFLAFGVVCALLEAQRHGLLMYTSCGWFFNDLAGIETVQILRYAARVIGAIRL